MQAIYANPSHSYRVSLAIWDHTVLPAIRHKRKHPASTPARQAGTRFTDHLRMECWVSPGPGCKEQLAHGCYLVVKRLGIEPATCQTRVRRRNHYTTKPPSSSSSIVVVVGIGLYSTVVWLRLLGLPPTPPLPRSKLFRDLIFSLCVKFGANPFKNGQSYSRLTDFKMATVLHLGFCRTGCHYNHRYV